MDNGPAAFPAINAGGQTFDLIFQTQGVPYSVTVGFGNLTVSTITVDPGTDLTIDTNAKKFTVSGGVVVNEANLTIADTGANGELVADTQFKVYAQANNSTSQVTINHTKLSSASAPLKIAAHPSFGDHTTASIQLVNTATVSFHDLDMRTTAGEGRTTLDVDASALEITNGTYIEGGLSDALPSSLYIHGTGATGNLGSNMGAMDTTILADVNDVAPHVSVKVGSGATLTTSQAVAGSTSPAGQLAAPTHVKLSIESGGTWNGDLLLNGDILFSLQPQADAAVQFEVAGVFEGGIHTGDAAGMGKVLTTVMSTGHLIGTNGSFGISASGSAFKINAGGVADFSNNFSIDHDAQVDVNGTLEVSPISTLDGEFAIGSGTVNVLGGSIACNLLVVNAGGKVLNWGGRFEATAGVSKGIGAFVGGGGTFVGPNMTPADLAADFMPGDGLTLDSNDNVVLNSGATSPFGTLYFGDPTDAINLMNIDASNGMTLDTLIGAGGAAALLQVSGTVTLAGDLAGQLVIFLQSGANFQTMSGDTWELIRAGSISGSFDDIAFNTPFDGSVIGLPSGSMVKLVVTTDSNGDHLKLTRRFGLFGSSPDEYSVPSNAVAALSWPGSDTWTSSNLFDSTVIVPGTGQQSSPALVLTAISDTAATWELTAGGVYYEAHLSATGDCWWKITDSNTGEWLAAHWLSLQAGGGSRATVSWHAALGDEMNDSSISADVALGWSPA